MESRMMMLSSPQNTDWDCDDSQHGRDAASSKGQKTDTESPVPSCSPSSDLAGNNYDVFLSFRGPDTRKSFTDLLYKSLTDAGIRVFRDDDELSVREGIKPTLIEAIKQSKVLIPIISRDYASSRGCLMELVQILECKQTMSRETIPIFYEIEVSDLKDQRNSFEKSFSEHQRNGVDCETIQKWKVALEEIGRLRGFETTKIHSRHHSKLIDELIPIVQQKLKKGRLLVTKNLVGVDHHVQEIMRKLGVVYRNRRVIEICGSNVRILGIYGIGGVGKTTLAKVVYNQLYDHFQGYSYIREIRELHPHDRILSLQNQLISDLQKRSVSFRCFDDAMAVLAEGFRNKQVLILLDDVEDVDQLNVVVGELSWFGPGSRIIVTSRKSDILLKYKEAEIHEVQPMEEDKALQLFSKRAFGRDSPSEGFENLSKHIVLATERLPIALDVTGSCLFGKSKGTWKDMLGKLIDAPHEKVEHVLKINYLALDIYAKQIFLDIACFLTGKDERIAFYMWEDCKLNPSSGIEVLLIMSLVKIGENNELLMHDLLRTLGRKIVLYEDPIPRNRSRLWVHDEALSTLRKKQGTPHVEALCLNFHGHTSDRLTPEEFESMPNLRFLQLDHADIAGDFDNVFSKLRWLCWRGCPQRLQVTNFHMENLTILNLSWSKITKDWEGWDRIEMKKLRVLDLTGCADLLVTPVFSGFKNLAILILEKCSQLVKIDHSIGNLKYLVSLNLKFCTELSMLPVEVGHLTALQELLMDGTSVQEIPISIGDLKQLEILSASNCFSFSQLPKTICHLTNISLLSLDGTRITALPDTIGKLVRLKKLSLRDCHQIRKLPNSIGNIGRSLVELDVSGTGIFKFPNSLKNLQNLKVLRMDSCFFSEFPRDIEELTSLEEIHASWCRSLEGGIPSGIRKLHNLRILRSTGSNCDHFRDSIEQHETRDESFILSSWGENISADSRPQFGNRRTFSSYDSEPSEPFQPWFLINPTSISSSGSKCDPFHDSIEQHKTREESFGLLFSSQGASVLDAAEQQVYGDSKRILVEERGNNSYSVSSDHRFNEHGLGKGSYLHGKDVHGSAVETAENSVVDSQTEYEMSKENDQLSDHAEDSSHISGSSMDLGSVLGSDVAGHEDKVRQDIEMDVTQKKAVDVNQEPKALRHFRVALIDYVKELLIPAWQRGRLSKDAHNLIVIKTVDKVLNSLQPQQIPPNPESIKHFLSFSQFKLARLVEAYVTKHGND